MLVDIDYNSVLALKGYMLARYGGIEDAAIYDAALKFTQNMIM